MNVGARPRTLRRKGDGSRPAEKTRRLEVKYSFHGADLDSLRQLLMGSCRRISFRDTVSTVRSIYFDDHGYRACRANLDGLSRREKVRLRWYDQPMPDDQIYFEVKWRRNRVTGKHRELLELSSPLSSVSYPRLTGDLWSALPTELRSFAMRYSQPVVLVEYHREHFICADPRFRITLDYDLKYFDQTGASAPKRRFGFEDRDAVVVEAKGPVDEADQLSRFLRPLVTRPTRSSKYVRGCAAVGVIHSLA